VPQCQITGLVRRL